jgi:UDP-N-acetylmuramoyl-tripeptide--D-alanyl-D-alanine ligase
MDNEWTMRMQARSHAKQIRFSAFRADVDVHMRAQRLSWDGLDIVGQVGGTKGQTWVHVFGRQNTINLMCAASLALAVGMPADQIWKTLGTIHSSAWGRNQLVPLSNGARVLFDAYNSNPDSMMALLKNLYEMDSEGRKFLVVGDMKELGTFTEAAHEEVGERAGGVGFEGIWYVGENAKSFARGLEKSSKPKIFITSAAPDSQHAAEFAQSFALGDLIAVKGSRGMELEKAVESWPLQSPLGKKP